MEYLVGMLMLIYGIFCILVHCHAEKVKLCFGELNVIIG
jgi:hypothetical protein